MKSIKLPVIHKKQTLFVGAVLIGVASALIYVLLLANQSGQQQAAEALVKQLQSQVDATDGSPRDGRDPASQGQTSLTSAAAQPTGTGQRTTQQTTTTATNSSHHTGGNTNLTAPGSAIGSNGCFVDYGKPGEQCLPAHAAPDGNLTCEAVKNHFASGIVVYGTDRFHLDTNHDGTACGSGDF